MSVPASAWWKVAIVAGGPERRGSLEAEERREGRDPPTLADPPIDLVLARHGARLSEATVTPEELERRYDVLGGRVM